MKISWTKYNEEHPNSRKLKAVLAEHVGFLYQQRVTDFYTGYAPGVNMWAGEAVLSLMELHPEVKLYCPLSRTGYTIHYAQAQGKPVIAIDPDNFCVNSSGEESKNFF